jgi:hypothetical protein
VKTAKKAKKTFTSPKTEPSGGLTVFELRDADMKRLNEWKKEQEAKARTMQGKKPYYGAIGGELTYMFTPTSLGVVVKVKHEYTGDVLDLTEYSDW